MASTSLRVPDTGGVSFRLAPMCTMIRIVTLVLLTLPIPFVIAAVQGVPFLIVPAVFLFLIYAWIWLRYRPIRFVVHQDALEVVWPFRSRRLAHAEISEVRVVSGRDLKAKVGWSMRVGAGGLWGGFGCLWTERRGVVQMYISRINDLVWIERTNERPWLISPERPQEFVQAMAGAKAHDR